ncbi:variable surface protein [Plasmodium gonderi]|uniref:Variable surface protein n=1 Tax=Plasmodium gonderi TaxID=77519 RepID=A0A1Y1JNH3_PLAGO|nr:variable surface protein [Plasmodium gonderi]GAW84021.1 variable surface protein [Plasmodium gonderi]
MGSLSEEAYKIVLGNTESYNIYNEFDAVDSSTKYTNYCNDFKKLYKLNDESNGNYCVKIAKNLEKLHESSNTSNLRDSCLHYKHWIYSRILNLVNSENNEITHVINYFLELQKYISEKLKNYRCFYHFHGNDLEYLKQLNEEKYLYEYFKYYYIIYNKITPHIVEKDNYIIYLSYIDQIYKKHKNSYCCTYYGLNDYCAHYFTCDERYDPNNLLCKINNDNTSSDCKPKGPVSSEKGSKGENSGNINFEEIKPFYFSCKEIKSEKGVPFLSCFVLRTDYKDTKKGNQAKINQPIDLSVGYISKAIEKIKYSSCVKNNKNPKNEHSAYTCIPKSDIQNQDKRDHIYTGERDSFQRDGEFEESTSSSSKPSNIDIRWMINESILECPANSSDKLRQQLCEYISVLKEKGDIQNHTKTENNKPFDLTHQPVHTSKEIKATINLNNFKCDSVNQDFCENLKKSFLSEIKEEVKTENHHDTRNNTSFQGSNETEGISESTLIITPNVLEQNYSIFKIFIFRVCIVVTIVIGTIFIFFIYYKFTGFGRWFDKIVLKKKNSKANFYYNENKRMPEYTPEYMYYSSKNKRTRISYTPA